MKAPLALPIILIAASAYAEEGNTARATLSGEGIQGSVMMTQTASGAVLVEVEATGVPEGMHGFHIHEIGECEGDFESAGGHIASGLDHGVGSDSGPHPGDLPNVYAGADGTLRAEFFTRGFTIGMVGDPRLLDDDGSAVILHAAPDDYSTQPAGNAGRRIACGVVETDG